MEIYGKQGGGVKNDPNKNVLECQPQNFTAKACSRNMETEIHKFTVKLFFGHVSGDFAKFEAALLRILGLLVVAGARRPIFSSLVIYDRHLNLLDVVRILSSLFCLP